MQAPEVLQRLLEDDNIKILFAALDGRGEELRIVGGALRNVLCGRKVIDLDLATTCLPDEIITRAQMAGLKWIPTGIEHGTLTLVIQGQAFEVTTLRRDVETDGRHAKVEFGRSFEEDALRRDFTINALSLDGQGRLYDYTQGQSDLAAGRVRFIGTARQRIREDYLRILRLFRFHAAYGEGPIDEEAMQGVIAERAGLSRLSRERIRAEFLKLLSLEGCVKVIPALAETGILSLLLGGVPHVARCASLVAHSFGAKDLPQSETHLALLHLAGLCLDVSEDADRLSDRLRLSRAEHARLSKAAQVRTALFDCASLPSALHWHLQLYRHGRQALSDGLALLRADLRISATEQEWADLFTQVQTTPEPVLPFRGADLIARGIAKGPQVSQILADLEQEWIAAEFTQDPSAIAAMLDKHCQSKGPLAD
ncbi:MAG: CCA tRNA nucleotidyltransferase [Alphaproteobacteria bacterium]|nr:CCA tRNA nucleotidyltransferase [Alphaproteobacteria bacterium]